MKNALPQVTKEFAFVVVLRQMMTTNVLQQVVGELGSVGVFRLLTMETFQQQVIEDFASDVLMMTTKNAPKQVTEETK